MKEQVHVKHKKGLEDAIVIGLGSWNHTFKYS